MSEELKAKYEYDPEEDSENRLSEIFEFLLEEREHLEKYLTTVNYNGKLLEK